MAPIPPGTPAARSTSARMRNLSCAVNVRRRGRSKSSGAAAAGAYKEGGRRPTIVSAPAAARVLLSLIWGITTGCLSYAPKGKLLAGVCLIIIGTEGFLGPRLHGDAGTTEPPGEVSGKAFTTAAAFMRVWNPGSSLSSAPTMALRSDTPEGATGMAKLLRGDKQVLVWAKPVASLIYHSLGRRM